MKGLAVLLMATLFTAPMVAQEPLDEDEWSFEEDLSGDDWAVDAELKEQMQRYAARLYRNRDRGYEQMIEGFGYLRELSFNESMREVEADFFELLGEALYGLMTGGLPSEIPKVLGLKLVDLPKLIPLIEAWGREVSPSGRRESVGEWIQSQWDRFRLKKAELPDPDELVEEMVAAYLGLDLDQQIDFELWLDEAYESEQQYREPDPLLIEQRVWEQWVNAHFSDGELAGRSCRGSSGCLELWLEAEEYLLRPPDFHLATAEVVVPGSDVVTAGLSRIMARANRQDRGAWRRRVRLLDFAVAKRVCFGSYDAWSADTPSSTTGSGSLEEMVDAFSDALGLSESVLPPPPCGWLGPNNETLTRPEDPEILELFQSLTWRHAGGGGQLGMIGWN